MHPWEKDQWLPGVLCKEQMRELVRSEYVSGVEDFDKASDYSSIDLHISKQGFEMIKGSIKPCGGEPTYATFLSDDKFAIPLEPSQQGYFELRASHCYVFKLKERLSPNLAKSNIYGQATAKTSVGRVDVIARLIVDGMFTYESMNPLNLTKATGQMYLEIIPITFNVRVKDGISLSQLRFFNGNIHDAVITEKGFIKCVLHGSEDGEGYLSVNLTNTTIGACEVAAFRAKNPDRENNFIDLWTKAKDEKPDPCDFWCFDMSDEHNRLNIKNGEFYLLRSSERISLPPGVAVYCRPMDETLGEMRIHYAGFVHPFFGTEREDDEKGTPLIFEVRGHNVDVTLAHKEKLAKLIFYRMSRVAEKEKKKDNEKKKNDYGNQELNLSKYFGEWPKKLDRGEDGNVKPSGEEDHEGL